MKKGQLLAALALAFALGVVAPVAGVYNSASVSALTFNTPIEKSTATGQDITNAISAVSANADYKTAESIISIYNTINAGLNDGTYAEFSNASAKAIVGAVDAITGGSDSSAAEIKSVYDKDSTTEIAGVSASGNASLAQTKAIISTVSNNSVYKAYNALNEAIVNGDKIVATNPEGARTALISALSSFYSALNTPENNQIDLTKNGSGEDAGSYAQLKAILNNTSDHRSIDTDVMSSIAAKIELAQENIDKYEAGLAVVNPILNNTNGILNEAGYNAVKLLTDAITESSDTYSLAAVKGIISNGTAYQPNFHVNLTNWAAVAALVSANTKPYSGDTTTNYGILQSIAAAYRTATDSKAETIALVAELAGYQAEDPTTPENQIRTIESTDKSVTVTGHFPEGAYVEVTPATMPENFEGFGVLNNAAYNIVIKNADGSIFTVSETVVVTIKVPAGINGANSDVFYITSMGGTENMKAKYTDGAMVFTTNHFSIYAVVERAAGDNGDGTVTPETPESGAIAKAEGTASATGILAGIAAALTAAGAAVVAFRNARRNAKKNA